MTQRSDTRLGIMLMTATTFVFALQDVISRVLAIEYNVMMVVMIRYWFFAAFVVAIGARKPGGVRAVAKTKQPVVQIIRGLLLSAQINVMVLAFVLLGLVESHAIFASYPLIIAALSGPILGEKVGWPRIFAIIAGFVGIVIILQPGVKVFSPAAFVPMIAAIGFALYSLLTRYAGRKDSAATSFFWTGTVGMVFSSAVGVWFWQDMTTTHYFWMAALCVLGALGHWLLIRTYEVAEASSVQPFAYLQLVFASMAGIFFLGETLPVNVAIGVMVVISAGLFTFWREHRKTIAVSNLQ